MGSTSPLNLFNVTFEDLSFAPNFKLIEALHEGLPKIGGWVEVEKKSGAGLRWIGGSKDLFRRKTREARFFFLARATVKKRVH